MAHGNKQCDQRALTNWKKRKETSQDTETNWASESYSLREAHRWKDKVGTQQLTVGLYGVDEVLEELVDIVP